MDIKIGYSQKGEDSFHMEGSVELTGNFKETIIIRFAMYNVTSYIDLRKNVTSYID